MCTPFLRLLKKSTCKTEWIENICNFEKFNAVTRNRELFLLLYFAATLLSIFLIKVNLGSSILCCRWEQDYTNQQLQTNTKQELTKVLQKYQKHHKLRHTLDLCGVRKARIGKLKTALNLRDFDIKMKHGHKSGNIFHSSCEKI